MRPLCTTRNSSTLTVPWRVYSNSCCSIAPGIARRMGVRSSACRWGISSTQTIQRRFPQGEISLEREYRQSTRLQRAVNAEVASLHATPVAETVDNARRQQGLGEMSPMRQPSPAGYQRRHGTKENGSTGEARGARRGKLVEEASPITVSGKWRRRHPGGGSGRSVCWAVPRSGGLKSLWRLDEGRHIRKRG